MTRTSSFFIDYRHLLGFAALTVVLGSNASAQQVTESNNARIKASCAGTAAALSGPARDRLQVALQAKLREVGRCRESGGVVLPNFWRVVAADSGTLTSLIAASNDINDARIFEAAFAAAADRSRPALVREAALVVLAGYVKPYLRGSVRRSNLPGEELFISVAYRAHVNKEESPFSLPADAPERIGNLLQSVASEKGSPRQLTGQARTLFAEISVIR